MKFNTMRMKITIGAGLCLVITAMAIILYSSYVMNRNAEITHKEEIESAGKYAAAVLGKEANYIKAVLEVALDTARAISHALSGAGGESAAGLDRAGVNAMLKAVLEKNPDFVGIATCWEPNAFDGRDMEFVNFPGHDETGRFIPYWNRDKNGKIVVEPAMDYETENAGDYYLVPRRTKKECIIEPYIYPVQGVPTLMTSLISPIIRDGRFLGIISVDMKLDVLQDIINNNHKLFDNTGQICLVSNGGTIAALTGNPDLLGKNMKILEEKDYEQDLEIIRAGKEVVQVQGNTLEILTPISIGYTGTPWFVKIDLPMKKIAEAADRRMDMIDRDRIMMAGISICCTLIALIIIGAIAGRLTRPLGAEPQVLSEIAQKIAKGQLDLRFNGNKGKIQGVYASMKQMTESLEAKVNLAESIADGDLSRDVIINSDRDQLGLALKKMTASLGNIINKVNDSAGQVASGSAQISDATRLLAEGASQQAASFEEMTSSMVELGSQTKSNAENSSQAAKTASMAKESADNGIQEMRNMICAMNEISDSSRSIAKIIKNIDEIAFQTNLLSLNAAVEAARAGRHGKGFAVVAGEVRNLAGRSAKAAKETAELIESTVKRIENGNIIADRTAEALGKISGFNVKVADLINEIAAASDEQAKGLEQINQGLAQTEQVTQQNTANAEEIASSAASLSAQADDLQKLLLQFKIDNKDDFRAKSGNTALQKDLSSAPSKPEINKIENSTRKKNQQIISIEEFGENEFEAYN